MNGLFKLRNFIDGKYVEPSSEKYIDNYDPSHGEVYSLVPDSDTVQRIHSSLNLLINIHSFTTLQEDVERAIEAAQKAFKGWSKTTAQQRSTLLNKVADIIERRLQEFAEAESKDQGKPVKLAKTVDILQKEKERTR